MNNYRFHGSSRSNTYRESNTENYEPIYKPNKKKEAEEVKIQ